MKDQLTKFDNKNITYDDIGNFVNYGNKDFTWINGTELSLYSDANNNKNVIYKYNDKGIRLSKESTDLMKMEISLLHMCKIVGEKF